MGDQSQGDRVNSRIILQLTVSEFGKLVVVTLGEVFANFAELLFDNMKIINEPFGSRRDRTAAAYRFYESTISGNEFSAVVLEPGQQTGPTLLPNDSVFGGKNLRVLLETFDAEHLLTDRLLVTEV
jgi:hypothetical protein